MYLVSFDIDGTLEAGDPPGPITFDIVRRAKELGYVVGSASDRTLSDQRKMWETAGIEVHFVANKHRLHLIRDEFNIARMLHIGDTTVDEFYAKQAGFDFWFVHELPDETSDAWIF